MNIGFKKTIIKFCNNLKLMIYDEAMKAGALGGKLIGAGRWRLFYFYCKKKNQKNLFKG